MKKLTFFRVISLLIVTVLVLSGSALAEDAKTADVEFAATEADGLVELEVTVKNATFMGIQVALSYDKNVLIPIDENGQETDEFDRFATKKSPVFNEIGLDLDKTNGYFGFTLFIMPGKTSENVNNKGEYVVDEDGVSLYTFKFKKIKEKSYSFKIITSADTDYAPAVESGLCIMDYDTGELATTVSFSYDERKTEQTTITPVQKPENPEEVEPKFTSSNRKKDVICLQIGKNQTVAYGKKKPIDPDNGLVVPYIVNDRTLVPLRFVAETLGAEVLWEEGWNGCIVKNGETEIEIAFGSAEFKLNGETVIYEAPIEVVHDRTMVPVRFISEAFGNDVYWNEKNYAVVISPADNPWIEDREAEITALSEMLVTITGILF